MNTLPKGQANSQNDGGNRWYPHVTVACIARRDDKYLLVRESNRKEVVINQPAGHVEKNETLVEAVIRETREETRWAFEPKYLVGIYQFVAANGETYIRFAFGGDLIGMDPEQELDPVIHEVIWLDRESLENSTEKLRSHVVLKCIDDFEQGKRISLERVQQLKSAL